MKILMVVSSKHGSTREMAEAIAEELRARQLEVDLREASAGGDFTGYDGVILGNAIYAGNWLPEAQRFAEEHRAALGQRPMWVFSSGPLGTENPQPHDDPHALAAPLGDVPLREHRVFVGKLDKESLGFAERLIVRAVKAPYGDFRDWAAIRAWAQEIAGALQAPAIPAG